LKPSRSGFSRRLRDRRRGDQLDQCTGFVDGIALCLIDAKLSQPINQLAVLDPFGNGGLAERSRPLATTGSATALAMPLQPAPE
jgi:hypothetical protein